LSRHAEKLVGGVRVEAALDAHARAAQRLLEHVAVVAQRVLSDTERLGIPERGAQRVSTPAVSPRQNAVRF
jgi:hypothetical protein